MTELLKSYLTYYKSQTCPRYAVLVTGAWGVGKTHQVRAALGDDEHYYASLHGISDLQEARATIISALSKTPEQARKFFTPIADALKDAGGLASLGGTFLSAAANGMVMMNIKPDRVLIIDDLERSTLGEHKLTGLISEFLEQHGFQIVLIAHDEKLESELRSKAEKIIGQTLRCEPQTHAVYDIFAEQIIVPSESGEVCDHRNQNAHEFLITNKDLILDLFETSNAKSLRILRHVMNDAARLWACLETRHLDCAPLMEHVLSKLVVLSIAVRAGRLSEEAVSDLSATYSAEFDYEKAKKKEPTDPESQPFRYLCKQYPDANLLSETVPSRFVLRALIFGSFDPALLQPALDRSHYLDTSEANKSWRRVSNYMFLSSEDAGAAISEMEQQFANRTVTNDDDLLHIFGLRLALASNGILDGSLDQIEEDCLAYIRDLRAEDRLPIRELHWDWKSRYGFYRSGEGYYPDDATGPHRSNLCDALIAARSEDLHLRMNDHRTKMLEMLKLDAPAFRAALDAHASKDTQEVGYNDVPILAAIGTDAFLEAFWNVSPQDRINILHTIRKRYVSDETWEDYPAEKQTIVAISKGLQAAAQSASGIERLQLSRLADLLPDPAASTPPG